MKLFVILITYFLINGWPCVSRFSFPELYGDENIDAKTEILKNWYKESPVPGYYIKNYDAKTYILSALCDKSRFNKGVLYYFKKNELCAIDAELLGENPYIIPKNSLPIALGEGFEKFEGDNNILIYKRGTKFVPDQTENGMTASIKDGIFFDSKNNPLFPYFYYSDGLWKEVLPVRELFKLEESGENWTLALFSSRKISGGKADISKMFGIKSVSHKESGRTAWGVNIAGKSLLSIKIPRFVWKNDGADDIRGVYLLSLAIPRKNIAEKKEVVLKNCTISYESVENLVRLEIRIKTNSISDEEISVIESFFKEKIPSFYVRK